MKLLSVNHYWRIIAAGLSYILFGIGALLPGLYIFCLALVPMAKAAKQRKVRRVIQRLCRLYVDIMQFLGLMTYTVEHRERARVEGHLVIANHTMLIDALFALAYVDNLCCVVKASLCDNPFTSVPIRLAGYIPNNHEDLVRLASERLEAQENVLIFPEGTRNQYDLQLNFKRGAANIAVISHSAILPIVICCIPRALGKGEKWYQLPDVKSRIIMHFEKPLLVEQCIDSEQPRTLQYRRLTQWLRDYYLQAVMSMNPCATDSQPR